MAGGMQKISKHTDLLGAVAVVMVVVMLVIPLPAFLIDMFITLNVSAGLAILVTTLYLPRSLDFAAFPSLLLLTTLFRLAINVSVTRMLLIHGSARSGVQALGNFVVGGNLLIGLVLVL